MTLSQATYLASQKLSQVGVDDALLEAEILTYHALGISRTQLYTEPERTISQVEANRLWDFVERRLHHEPAAYILGCCGFYGLDFYVDRRALIPRPETELLVEEAIKSARQFPCQKDLTIADIGTGSGAIAISLALALPQSKIYATDISIPALQVSEVNCQRFSVDSQVRLLGGDLLEPLPEPVDIMIANLPYIKDSELWSLSPEIIDFEPIIALAGGQDGLDKIRGLLGQIPGSINPQGCLLIEIGQGQEEAVTSLVNAYFPQARLELIPDLSGIDRVVKISFEQGS